MCSASCSTCSARNTSWQSYLTSLVKPQTYDVGGRQWSESIKSHGNTSAGFGYSSCALPARYLFISRVVEWLKPSLSVTLRCFVRHVWTVVRTCSKWHVSQPIDSNWELDRLLRRQPFM